MSFDSQTSFAIPDPPEDSPLVEPPSWSEYLEDYGVPPVSELAVPDFPSPPEEQSVSDLLSWQSDETISDYFVAYANAATTDGLSNAFASTESTLGAINSTLAVNETTTTWMQTVATNVTELLAGHLEANKHELTMIEKEERILVPEGVVVFVLMLSFIVFGLIRIKCKNDSLIKQTRDAVAMNTNDLAFYHQVEKMPTKDDSTDVCDTKLPDKMPAVGLHDISSKYTSLVPILTDFNIIPGSIEIVRVQMRTRPSFLPQHLRASQSLPDTLHETRPIETLGRCPRTTSSSPAIMNGLWQHYREELVQKGLISDVCPYHGTELHPTMSNTSASDGRVTPPAFRGESEGFEMRAQSSGSTIPRKITCRFCRERAVRTPWSTPGTSPLLIRKAVTPPRSPSHVSVLQSGIAAIAEEVGSIPSHALCSLGPVKIDHMEDIKIVETDRQPSPPTPAAVLSHSQIIKPTDEEIWGRRPSCRPEIRLDAFKSLLTSSSSHGSKSGGSLKTTSVSSSNFAARLKEDGLYQKSSIDINKQRSSSVDLHVASSTKSRSSHRFGIGKSKSDNLASTSSKYHTNGSRGHLEKSSSDGRYESLTGRHIQEALIDGTVGDDQSESSGHLSEDDTSSQDSSGNDLPSDNTICKVHSMCQNIVSQVASVTSADPILVEEHVNLQRSSSLKLGGSVHSATPSPSIKKSSLLELSGNRPSPLHSSVRLAKSSSVRFAESVHSQGNLAKTNSSNVIENVLSRENNIILAKSSSHSKENNINLAKTSSSRVVENVSSRQSSTRSVKSSSVKSIGSSPSGDCDRSPDGIVAESTSPKLAISDHSCSQSTCCCNLTSKSSSKKSTVIETPEIEVPPSNNPIDAARSAHEDVSTSSKPSSKNSVDITSSSTLTSVTPMNIDDSMHSIGRIDSYILSSETSTNKSQSGEHTSNSSDQALYSSHALNKGGSGKLIKSFSKLFSSSESDQMIWQRKSNRSVTEMRSQEGIGASSNKGFSMAGYQSQEGNLRLVASTSRKLRLSDQVLAEIGGLQMSGDHAMPSNIRHTSSKENGNISGDVPQAPDGLRGPPELQVEDVHLSERPEVDGEDNAAKHFLLHSYYGEDSTSESSSEDELTWLQKF